MTATSPHDPVEGATSPKQAERPDPDVDPVPAPSPGEQLGAKRVDQAQGMIPARSGRGTRLESVAMRILATGGIIGIAVALGAILGANNVAGWIIGLAVGLTSVVLAAVLWSSRQL